MSQNTKSGSKNGNILSYFKPVSQSQTSQASQARRATAPAIPKSPSPLPTSSPLSLRSTPVKPAPVSKTLEIRDSDEDSDGSSSDNSLADLSVLIGRSRPGNASRPTDNAYSTPRSKRTAIEFQSSPLAFMPKHKFDLKALAKDALQDDATNASSLRVRAARNVDEDMGLSTNADANDDALVGIVTDSIGQDAQKVLRAVKRAEAGNSLLWYCFFDTEPRTSSPVSIPRKAATGPWRLLTHGNVKQREQHLVSGLPHTILTKSGGLPDELLIWMLDEIVTQKSPLMRQEYSNLVALCPEQVHELITPEKLEGLLKRVGAEDDLQDTASKLVVSKPAEDPYKDRDWSCLESLLQLLGQLSKKLSIPSVIYAARMLLRMSLDRFLILNTQVLAEYEVTIQSLLSAIPQPSWDSFCYDTCSQLYSNITIQCIRTNALLCLPINNSRVHQLRRKLALTFLFEDPTLSRTHPDDTVTLKGIIERLKQNDFVVTPRTDFAELKARIILLDMCIDNGSFTPTDDPEDEKTFNEEVDEIAIMLRDISRKINDTGMKLARTEAKSVIEWVQHRLTYSVRTKRKAKKSIFDLPGQKMDPFLPRQQDFMKKFIKKAPKTETDG